jgi:cytochrome c oxidase subunit 2
MRPIVLSAFISAALMFLGSASQAQEFFGGNFMLKDALDAPKRYCLDLEGYAFTTDTSAPVIVHSCKEGLFKDGTWKVDYPLPGNVYLPEYKLCAAAESLQEEANVVLQSCSDALLQKFVFRDDGKVEVTSDSAEKFCLAVGETSRPTGNNLRRETRIVACEDTDESFTQWILPGEDAVYPVVINEPVQDGAGPARPGGMGMGMGMGGNNLYVGACAPCHGRSGEGYASEFSPKLSGQEDWYLRRQLANFRNDLRGDHDSERWAKQMNFHIKDFAPGQLDAFVSYIQTLDDNPASKTIDADSTRGKELYTQSCVACHAENGMGNVELNSPRLTGMSDWYMVIQLQKYRTDLRGDHPDDVYGKQMAPFAKALPDEQALLDVVAYINTLEATTM